MITPGTKGTYFNYKCKAIDAYFNINQAKYILLEFSCEPIDLIFFNINNNPYYDTLQITDWYLNFNLNPNFYYIWYQLINIDGSITKNKITFIPDIDSGEKQSNPNSKVYSCICCKEYNPYANSNLNDKFICYRCKSTYGWKYEDQSF